MRSSSVPSGFFPYAAAAVLIGSVGGFSTVLGPAFVAELGLAYQNTTWTALAQAVSTAACAPILGSVGDRIGRRPTLLLGVLVFTLGNVLSALAGSLGFMLAARFIVGIGAAAMAPTILSYIVTEFPKDRTAAGFSLYMLLSSAAVIPGPTLGALMIDAWGWRAMLWLCAALGAVTLLCCLAAPAAPESPRRAQRGFDTAGAVWALLFFSLLLCIPSFGQSFGWRSAAFWSVLLAGIVTLAGLLSAEARAERPILSGAVLKRRRFILSVLALFLTQGLMQANMTCLIVFCGETQPGRAALSGVAISVLYLGMALGAALLGPLTDRKSPGAVLLGALALTGAGCGLMLLFSARTPLALLAGSLGLLGVGLGGGGTILMKLALAGLAPEQAGAGTGAYGLFRDLAAPFGVAVLVPLFTNHLTSGGALPAIRLLALVELGCVAGAAVVAAALLKLRKEDTT